LWERWQSGDPAADGAWEDALDRYGLHLDELLTKFTPNLREFADLLLHDAVLESLSGGQGRLVMVLRTDTRPSEVLFLTYALLTEPELVPYASSSRAWGLPTRFDFDEVDHADGQEGYTQSIVFDNGWELRLRFRGVQITRGEPITPKPAFASVAVNGPSTGEQEYGRAL